MFDQLPQLCIDLIGEKITETSDIWTKEDVAHDLLVLMAVNKSCQSFAKELVVKVDPPNDYDRLVVNWKDKNKPTKIMFSTALKTTCKNYIGKMNDLKERLHSIQGRSTISGMSYAFTKHLHNFHSNEENIDNLMTICDKLGIWFDREEGWLYYKGDYLGDFNIGEPFYRWELLGYMINHIGTLENVYKTCMLLKQKAQNDARERKLQIMKYAESKGLQLMNSMVICHEYIEDNICPNIISSYQEIDDMHFLCTHTDYMKCLSKWNYLMKNAMLEIYIYYKNKYPNDFDTLEVSDMIETEYENMYHKKYNQILYETLQRYFRKCKNRHMSPHSKAIDIATRLTQYCEYGLVVKGKMRGI